MGQRGHASPSTPDRLDRSGSGTGLKRSLRRVWRAQAFALVTICMLIGWAPAALASTPLTPSATTTPALTGAPKAGETVSCSTGSWTNDPSSFGYEWLRDGVPIAGQTGSAYVVQAADEGHSIACRVTANVLGGEYEITGLPSESYRVSFSSEGQANYLTQYFSGESFFEEATPVTVTAPSTTPNINATLAVGGEITGRVTSEAGAPLANIEVCIGFLSCRQTKGNGEYAFSALKAGNYKVKFNPDALDPAWVCEAATCEYEAGEDEVTVAPPDTTAGVDAVLKARSIPSGAISGTVSGSGVGLANIQVCASVYEKVSNDYCETTDGNGQYTISSLPAGVEYEVGFYPLAGVNYIARLYDVTREGTTPVPVTAGLTMPANETLEEGGGVIGRVTNGYEVLANVEVCPDDFDVAGFVRCTETDSRGEYRLVGLPGRSDHEIYFKPPQGRYENYFAPSAEEAYLPRVEPEVDVTVGLVTAMPDVTLQQGGSISGSVTTTGGAAFAGGEVCAHDPKSLSLYAGKKCAFAKANGEYTIVGLAGGSDYNVVFQGKQCSEDGCVQEYLGGPYGRPVSVNVGETTEDIDAELAEGAKITGAVTGSGGGYMSEVGVCASALGGNNAYEANELKKCARPQEAFGSASETSNALTISVTPSEPKVEPKGRPRAHFKLLKKRFDAKTDKLELFFEVPGAGSLTWNLTFKGTRSIAGKGKAHRKVSGFFGKGARKVSRGAVEIKVKASAKAAKALRSGMVLHVKGEVSLKLAGGGLEVTKLNVVAHQAKQAKGKHKHAHKRG